MIAPTNHQISDFGTPRYSNDPQDGNNDPLCEKMNFTYEPSEEMCRNCEVSGCEDRVSDES